MAFGSASADVPSLISMANACVMPPWRMAAANSRAGSAMWRGFSPWPYSTAGTRPARRVRRAPPLPNSVRGSALIFTSDTGILLNLFFVGLREVVGGAGREGALGTGPEHRVDHGALECGASISGPQGTLAVATASSYPSRHA